MGEHRCNILELQDFAMHSFEIKNATIMKTQPPVPALTYMSCLACFD